MKREEKFTIQIKHLNRDEWISYPPMRDKERLIDVYDKFIMAFPECKVRVIRTLTEVFYPENK